MVQIYNPNVVGKQILTDVINIHIDKLKTVEMIRPFKEKIIEELKIMLLASVHINLKKMIFLVLP